MSLISRAGLDDDATNDDEQANCGENDDIVSTSVG